MASATGWPRHRDTSVISRAQSEPDDPFACPVSQRQTLPSSRSVPASDALNHRPDRAVPHHHRSQRRRQGKEGRCAGAMAEINALQRGHGCQPGTGAAQVAIRHPCQVQTANNQPRRLRKRRATCARALSRPAWQQPRAGPGGQPTAGPAPCRRGKRPPRVRRRRPSGVLAAALEIGALVDFTGRPDPARSPADWG